jgi:hypothetical protein
MTPEHKKEIKDKLDSINFKIKLIEEKENKPKSNKEYSDKMKEYLKERDDAKELVTASCKCGGCVRTYYILTDAVLKDLNNPCLNCKTVLKVRK